MSIEKGKSESSPPQNTIEAKKLESSPPQNTVEAKKIESSPSQNTVDAEKLEWIETFRTLEDMNRPEGLGAHMRKKIKENPFVPIGMVATTIALSFGVYAMRSGNKRRSQLMMRTRIFAQGFTVGAIIIGVAVSAANRAKTK